MSFYDMIPDKMLTVPVSGTHGDRCALRSKVNLIETTCGQCGGQFTRHTGHVAYMRYKGCRKIFFCSWSCLCAWDRERPVRKKGGSTKTLQERIDDRMMKMIADRRLLNSDAQLSEQEVKRIKNRLAWNAKEIRELEEELEFENSRSLRGIAGGDDRAAQAGT